MMKQSSQLNENLRYSEALHLNKKGYMACFKGITRMKRNMQLDGKNIGVDKVPPVAHYTPKYDIVDKNFGSLELKGRDIHQSGTSLQLM